MGWKIPQLLDTLEQAPHFYLGPIAQVKMPGWTSGCVALVGDAAYRPSPFTGHRTSLAIVGTYVLDWELACSPDHHDVALSSYEHRMRPFVEFNQAIADLSRDPRFGEDPQYYVDVIEPATEQAKRAVELPNLT